ncbi:MAG: peroxidase-related enzyme, partial [Acetobacteraceae bacterium]
HRKADITPRQRAMLDFAVKVSQESHLIDDADSDALRAHGFSDDDIWDIAMIAAFFAMSNRMASFAGLRPNREFYTMGRG